PGPTPRPARAPHRPPARSRCAVCAGHAPRCGRRPWGRSAAERPRRRRGRWVARRGRSTRRWRPASRGRRRPTRPRAGFGGAVRRAARRARAPAAGRPSRTLLTWRRRAFHASLPAGPSLHQGVSLALLNWRGKGAVRMSTRRAGAHTGGAPVSRRGVLLGGAGLAAMLAVGACGKVEDRSAQSGKGGPWSFVDDRQRKASAKSTPTNVVAQVSASAALWDLGIKSVGVFGEANGPDDLYGNIDRDAVTWVGKTWGEFDMEKFLGLRPDVLVAPMNTPDELWYVPEEMADEVAKRCPTVGIKQLSTPLDKVIDRYAELAASLGVDLEKPEIATARKDFTAAVDELRA